jgi:hypothetical protein
MAGQISHEAHVAADTVKMWQHRACLLWSHGGDLPELLALWMPRIPRNQRPHAALGQRLEEDAHCVCVRVLMVRNRGKGRARRGWRRRLGRARNANEVRDRECVLTGLLGSGRWKTGHGRRNYCLAASSEGQVLCIMLLSYANVSYDTPFQPHPGTTHGTYLTHTLFSQVHCTSTLAGVIFFTKQVEGT